MADKATNGTDELVQAYNRAVESAVGAFDTSVAQATNDGQSLLADTAETERKEFARMVEQSTVQARKRSENLAAVLPEMLQGFAVKPGAVAPDIGPEIKESSRQAGRRRDSLLRVPVPGVDAVHLRGRAAAKCGHQGPDGWQCQGDRVQP